PLGPMRDAVNIVRGVLGGERFEYDGDTWSADVPALAADAHSPRDVPPVYVAATAPKMQALAGEIGDGCLTPSITTPAFVRYTRGNVAADVDIGCTVVASIHETDREGGRDGAREIAGMYLANKFQTIRGSADTSRFGSSARKCSRTSVAELRVQRDRLVEWASRAIGTPSFTGSEDAMAELMRGTFLDLGLQVQWQQVEEGRANVLGTLPGS